MPVYEYECGACNRVYELQQKVTDAPMAACPNCGGKVEKLISMSSFALKGAGFYTNDYKRAGQSAAPAAPPCATGGCCPGGGCAGSH